MHQVKHEHPMNYFANTVLPHCLQKYYTWKKVEMVISCLFAYIRATCSTKAMALLTISPLNIWSHTIPQANKRLSHNFSYLGPRSFTGTIHGNENLAGQVKGSEFTIAFSCLSYCNLKNIKKKHFRKHEQLKIMHLLKYTLTVCLKKMRSQTCFTLK